MSSTVPKGKDFENVKKKRKKTFHMFTFYNNAFLFFFGIQQR